MILYSPPTVWSLLRGAAINLLLPFVNGLMLGFGELFANEAAFRLGWGGTKVRGSLVLRSIREMKDMALCCLKQRGEMREESRLTYVQVFPSTGRRVGPGVEMRDDPVERRRRDGEELDAYTSLE